MKDDKFQNISLFQFKSKNYSVSTYYQSFSLLEIRNILQQDRSEGRYVHLLLSFLWPIQIAKNYYS